MSEVYIDAVAISGPACRQTYQDVIARLINI